MLRFSALDLANFHLQQALETKFKQIATTLRDVVSYYNYTELDLISHQSMLFNAK